MNQSVTKEEYRRWLRAAYIYYHGFGEDSGMTDHAWDSVARRINPEDWDELRGTGYEAGQSLFWLKRNEYPDWAKE